MDVRLIPCDFPEWQGHSLVRIPRELAARQDGPRQSGRRGCGARQRILYRGIGERRSAGRAGHAYQLQRNAMDLWPIARDLSKWQGCGLVRITREFAARQDGPRQSGRRGCGARQRVLYRGIDERRSAGRAGHAYQLQRNAMDLLPIARDLSKWQGRGLVSIADKFSEGASLRMSEFVRAQN